LTRPLLVFYRPLSAFLWECYTRLMPMVRAVLYQWVQGRVLCSPVRRIRAGWCCRGTGQCCGKEIGNAVFDDVRPASVRTREWIVLLLPRPLGHTRGWNSSKMVCSRSLSMAGPSSEPQPHSVSLSSALAPSFGQWAHLVLRRTLLGSPLFLLLLYLLLESTFTGNLGHTPGAVVLCKCNWLPGRLSIPLLHTVSGVAAHKMSRVSRPRS